MGGQEHEAWPLHREGEATRPDRDESQRIRDSDLPRALLGTPDFRGLDLFKLEMSHLWAFLRIGLDLLKRSMDLFPGQPARKSASQMGLGCSSWTFGPFGPAPPCVHIHSASTEKK